MLMITRSKKKKIHNFLYFTTIVNKAMNQTQVKKKTGSTTASENKINVNLSRFGSFSEKTLVLLIRLTSQSILTNLQTNHKFVKTQKSKNTKTQLEDRKKNYINWWTSNQHVYKKALLQILFCEIILNTLLLKK